MMATQAISHLVVVLDFPTRIDNFILYAKGIHDTMSNNAAYSGSTAKLHTLKNDTTTLETKETGMHTTPPILDFRHRDILKDGPGDWSDPIEWVIQ